MGIIWAECYGDTVERVMQNNMIIRVILHFYILGKC